MPVERRKTGAFGHLEYPGKNGRRYSAKRISITRCPVSKRVHYDTCSAMAVLRAREAGRPLSRGNALFEGIPWGGLETTEELPPIRQRYRAGVGQVGSVLGGVAIHRHLIAVV